MDNDEQPSQEHPWAGKKPTAEELKQILADHEAWVEAGMKGNPPHNLRGVVLKAATLANANLQRADLQGADLQGAFLPGANLTKAKLQEAKLQEAKLQEANLQMADLQEADLTKANLQKANLQKANLQKAYLSGANLQVADLLKANLQKANLQVADLSKANLHEANLQMADLQQANLQQALLLKANLQEADLTKANLQEAYLQHANLQEADLTKANLQGGWLKLVNLTGAFVSETIMQEADLTEANFTNAKGLVARNLAGANLTGAVLPESVNKFRIAESVALTAAHARKLFSPLILAAFGVAYLAFMPAQGQDSNLIPLSTFQVPRIIFASLSPIVLLVWNFFFLLYLGRLWQGLASLPAVFPEGVPLTHHPDSWFPITIIRLRLKRLGGWAGKLQGTGAALLVWGLLPFLLFLMACGFSRLGDFKVNLIAASTFLISLALSLRGFRKAMLELTAAYNDKIASQRRWSAWALAGFLVFSLLALVLGWTWWLKLLELVRSWVASW